MTEDFYYPPIIASKMLLKIRIVQDLLYARK